MVSFNKEYYKNIMDINWYDPFEFWYFNFDIWWLSSEELQIRFLCHHNADKFIEDKKIWKKSIVTTGFWMSWAPHIWTISQLMRILKINDNWVDTQIVLWDLDAYCGKNVELNKVLEYKEKYINFISKLWYKNNPWSIIRWQFNELWVLRTSYLAGLYMNDDMFDNAEEDLHDLYVWKNKVDSSMTYRRRTSLSLMIWDFLDLWMSNDYLFDNTYSNVAVMLWIDEHKYVKFWEKTLENIKSKENALDGYFNKSIWLSAIYTPIIKWFNNYPKQSKSFPDSSINADSGSDDINKKILYQEGDYKNPEDNVVYQMIAWIWNYKLEDYRNVYEACRKWWSRRVKYKKEFVEYLIDILNKWER